MNGGGQGVENFMKFYSRSVEILRIGQKISHLPPGIMFKHICMVLYCKFIRLRTFNIKINQVANIFNGLYRMEDQI